MYDVIIIGAGASGLTVAFGLAGAGKKVLLIEKGKIGGDCTNVGCVPSKALLYEAKKGDSFEKTMNKVRGKREEIRKEETPEILKSHNIDVIKGEGKVVGKHEVTLGNKLYKTKRIIIATGSKANKISIKGIDDEKILTNENIFEIKNKINDLIIIGGGYIAIELGEAFLNLGVRVKFILRSNRLLTSEDFETSTVIEKYLSKLGATFYKSAEVLEVENNYLRVKLKDRIEDVKFDKILLAIGRKRNFEGITDKDLDITTTQDGFLVDDYNRTNIKSIYAIGDCVSGNELFTHNANNEGRGVVRNILVPFWKSKYRNKTIPKSVYTDLEIARVGETEEKLKEIYGENEIVTIIHKFNTNDKSKLTSDTEGFIKITFKKHNGKILGATIVGKNASEMINIINSYIENKVSAFKVSNQVFPYPCKAELIKKIASEFTIYYIKNFKEIVFCIIKCNIVKIISILIWLGLIIAFYNYKINSGLSIEEIGIQILNYLMGAGTFGGLIYILLYAIRPLVFFPATFMTIIAGILFGGVLGTIYTVIGETISAGVSYFFSKNISFKKLHGNGVIKFIKEKADKDTFRTILLTRLLFFPFDLVNYVSGFLKIKFKPFMYATFLGIIPGAATFVFLGASFHNKGEVKSFADIMDNFNPNNLYIAIGLFVLAILLSKFIKNGKKI